MISIATTWPISDTHKKVHIVHGRLASNQTFQRSIGTTDSLALKPQQFLNYEMNANPVHKIKPSNITMHNRFTQSIVLQSHHRPLTSVLRLNKFFYSIQPTRAASRGGAPQASYDICRHRNCFQTRPMQAFSKK